MGGRVEEFKLVYYLNNIHQLVIDSWLVWAFSKHVQRLILDFTPPPAAYGCIDAHKHYYVLDPTLVHSCITNTTKLYLTTLCLKCVNVDTSTLNYLLHASASTLENLCIHGSHYLTTISAASFPSLKSFTVVDCPQLETIDIQAPNLVSLTYNSGWNSILTVFNVANASKLSYANIIVRLEQRFLFALRSLFIYFSHLDHLKLQWHACRDMNLVLVKFPVLANLKHLEINVLESGRRTLAAWVPFIAACPRLEKLTLEIRGWLRAVPAKNVYEEKCPLRCLKTFEIRSFDGKNLDVDIANFVVENGINLEEVILHPCDLSRPLNMEAPFGGMDFELPPHVKLVIVK